MLLLLLIWFIVSNVFWSCVFLIMDMKFVWENSILICYGFEVLVGFINVVVFGLKYFLVWFFVC